MWPEIFEGLARRGPSRVGVMTEEAATHRACAGMRIARGFDSAQACQDLGFRSISRAPDESSGRETYGMATCRADYVGTDGVSTVFCNISLKASAGTARLIR